MKKKNVLITLGVLIVLVCVIGVSYAIWQVTLTQTDKNTVTTSCFKIEFQDANPLNLEKSYPILNEEGKNLMPYTFTIKNTCDTYATYQINLEVLNTSTLINLDTIRVLLNETNFEKDSSLLESYDVVESTLSNATTSYKLETGYLNKEEEKTFELRLWLDENTPTDEAYMNKVLESKVTVITSYLNESPTYAEVITNCSNNGYKTTDCMLENSNYDTTNLAYDETTDNNLRYIGSSPNNYVSFGGIYETDIYDLYNSDKKIFFGMNFKTVDECLSFKSTQNIDENITCLKVKNAGEPILWRIIGVMNNIKSDSNEVATRIKIIRDDSIGSFSWDSSESNINTGYGVNEWSTSDIKIVLNDYYFNKKNNQICYNDRNNATASCDFDMHGMEENLKLMTETVLWNTGSNGKNFLEWGNLITTQFYELERSNNTGKICSPGTTAIRCNDNVERTTTWMGKIGLLYPSDYGYAVGNNLSIRNECMSQPLYNWSKNESCYQNNWLSIFPQGEWTMTPITWTDVAHEAFSIYNGGVGYGDTARGVFKDHGVIIRPTLYLKQNLKIISGNGTKENSYKLELIS